MTQPLLQTEQPVQVGGREKAVDKHPPVEGADPVDASVPLHHPHRVPGQVVVDDPPRLLQVHPLREDIGGEHQVVSVFISARRFRGEPGDDASPGLRVETPFGSVHRWGHSPPEVGQRVIVIAFHDPHRRPVVDGLNGVGEAGEDQGFAPVAGTGPLPADGAGFGGDLPQSFQQLLQFRIGPLRYRPGTLPQPAQQFQVGFHILPQLGGVIIARFVHSGGGPVVQALQKLIQVFIVGGGPFPQRLPGQHHPAPQRLQESPVGVHHFLQRVEQGGGRRFQTFQEGGAEQPGVGNLIVELVVGFNVPGPGGVAGQEQTVGVALAVVVAAGVFFGVVQRVHQRLHQVQALLIQVVVQTFQHRLGELYGHPLSLVVFDGVALIVLFHEAAGAAHRHLIQQVEQVLVGEAVLIHFLRPPDVFVNGGDAQGGEGGVVADEQRHQGMQVEQGVVDRGGGEQHQPLGMEAAHQGVDRGGALRVRVAQIVGFVHHHQRVFVQLPADVLLPVPPTVAELVVGHNFHPAGEVMFVQKRLPHSGFEGGGSDDQHPLAADGGGPVDDFPGHKSLPQTDFVGHYHPAVFVQDAQHAGHAFPLKSGEFQFGAGAIVIVFLQMSAVEFP